MCAMTEAENAPPRRLVCGALLAGVGGAALSACGSSGAGSAPTSTSSSPTVAAGKPIIAAAKVPVGGMTLISGLGLVVTQPKKGEFRAFSAICTHQGNPLDPSFADGNLHCSRHGSEFSPVDGHVERGPATRALPEIKVKVDGGQVVRA